MCVVLRVRCERVSLTVIKYLVGASLPVITQGLDMVGVREVGIFSVRIGDDS